MRMDIATNESRRRFLKQLATGATVVALGGLLYEIADDDLERQARAQKRDDGRPRLPPGQRLIRALRPMGGIPYEGTVGDWRLRVHGEVDRELTLDFQQLLALPQTEQASDVHCVTAWTVLDAKWTGVRVAELAKMAGIRRSARHVIFESFAGYTANVPLAEALAPDVLVAHQLDGRPLPRPNGPPVRALVPGLYFWKSAKWLKGIRFSSEDEPGYWEVRGYHNHADPWREERYA
jgi:DMSO/TMAO reductase YedYZ molybdopterin-dependent catalytic subunit